MNKRIYTFQIPFLFFCLSTLLAGSVHSADKIGNGGGVWVCQGQKLEVYDIMFMDVFEARREYQLNLPESNDAPLTIVQAQKKWIEKFLTDPRQINKHIEYVEKNITWIEDVINMIPDGANKISPHPSTCKNGEWTAVQLVNFTDDFRILVRREIFESSYMSNLEKAAVYLHEGIYSFLRTQDNDTNSVRARAIVGYLLSNLPDSEKQAQIQKILSQEPVNPIDSPAEGWMCGLKPSTTSPLYIFESPNAKSATTGVIEACRKGEDPMPNFPGGPDIPGGVFPGNGNFPGDFGPGRECQESKVLCEAIKGSARTKTCEITVGFHDEKTYRGQGRTNLEAQREAMNLCNTSEGDSHTCNRYSKLECH